MFFGKNILIYLHRIKKGQTVATRSLLILVFLTAFDKGGNISDNFQPEVKASEIISAAPACENAILAFSADEELEKSCDKVQNVIIGVPGANDHNSRITGFNNVQLTVYSRKTLACSYKNKLLDSETSLKSPLVKILRL